MLLPCRHRAKGSCTSHQLHRRIPQIRPRHPRDAGRRTHPHDPLHRHRRRPPQRRRGHHPARRRQLHRRQRPHFRRHHQFHHVGTRPDPQRHLQWWHTTQRARDAIRDQDARRLPRRGKHHRPRESPERRHIDGHRIISAQHRPPASHPRARRQRHRRLHHPHRNEDDRLLPPHRHPPTAPPRPVSPSP